MTIRNERLGEIEVAEQDLVHLPEGLVGFEDHGEFVLHRSETYDPFCWLVSMNDPELVFAVADPDHFVTESYVLTVGEMERELLQLRDDDAVEVYVIVSSADPDHGLTGNLKAPLLVNARTRRGKQLLLYSSRFSTRQPFRTYDATLPRAESERVRTIVRSVSRKAA
jgi:flagellar assembly factor FliW